MTAPLDEETLHTIRLLQSRATSLQDQAGSLPAPLANAYRRRARELELEAYVLSTRLVPRETVAAV